MNMLEALSGLAALAAALPCAYLLALTLLSWKLPRRARGAEHLRFAIVVPAHNEAAGIARTVRSLRALDWPRYQFQILVVADNCSDNTAALAAAAGATVLERTDDSRRGKGYALDHALRHLLAQDWADAYVVIDADSEADRNLLREFAAAFAAGEHAMQAHYAVLNPNDSWRTRLMTIALSAFHGVRSRGRERLGLSSGIRGNGWCVTKCALREVPYRSYSLVEDVEYGARLGLAGIRVACVEDASVRGEMVSRADNAAAQRRRWEQGRGALRRELLPPLLRNADAVCLDLAADLIVPPLSQLAVAVVACMAAAIAFGPAWAMQLAAASAAALALYLLRGWQLSGLGRQGLIDLLRAPWFIAWKLAVLARGSVSGWVRTARERP